jgi:hypothetical protein
MPCLKIRDGMPGLDLGMGAADTGRLMGRREAMAEMGGESAGVGAGGDGGRGIAGSGAVLQFPWCFKCSER